MNHPFPSPIYFGRRRYWRLFDVVSYERALAGLPPPNLDADGERLLTSAQMRERYGGVSDMWLWRRTTGAERDKVAA